MLLSEQAISAVTNVVTAEDFYKPAHRHIFDAIQSLYAVGEGVDPVTVADELARADVLEPIGGSARLVTLQARTPAITNALHYAKIVEEKALLRKLITTANDVADLGYSPLDDIEKTIDSAEAMMFAVAQRRNTDSMAALAPLLDREPRAARSALRARRRDHRHADGLHRPRHPARRLAARRPDRRRCPAGHGQDRSRRSASRRTRRCASSGPCCSSPWRWATSS